MREHLFRHFCALSVGTITIFCGVSSIAVPAASAAPLTIDTSNEAAVNNAYLNVYLPTQSVPVDWTGAADGCDAGQPSAAAQDAIVTAFNYMRAMAGLPAVTENTTESANVQQAALMMQANGELSHSRPSTWTCYTTAGADNYWAAGQSDGGGEIIADTNDGLAAPAIPLYMLDPGDNNQAMGHRAAVLSAQATQIGSGSTTDYNAIHFNNLGPAATASYSWPTAGYFPSELVATSATRWSFYPQTGDASGATVTVTKNGTPLAITNSYPVHNAVDAATGAQTGLGWDMPTIVAPAAGAVDTYHVTISGGTGSAANASYDVKLFNAMETAVNAVTISGTPQVGTQLTATATGLSPADATLAYSWSRNGTPIPGATSSTYTPVAADLGAALSVTVTAAKDGFTSASTTSDATAAVQKGALTTATPTISGTAEVGQTLTASATGWGPSGVGPSYQWYADGSPVSGATAATYPLTAADLGKTITVSVTGTLDGYDDATVASAPTAQVVPGTLTTSTPTISGTAVVGRTLTASAVGWGPSGVQLSYQWTAGGDPISGATASTYVPGSADLGQAIAVRVTGTLAGYTTATEESASTDAVTLGVLATSAPTITGSAVVGQTLTATTTGWGPNGITLAYQWYADGAAISGATATTYDLTNADLGRTISVKVTASLAGYDPVTATSESTYCVLGVLTPDAPSISGVAQVGQPLTANSGNWDPSGADFTYQWNADDTPISGATGTTFTPTAADLGQTITVTVTGTLPGYVTTAATTQATSAVVAGTLSVGAPSITGTPVVGQTLTVDTGTWTPSTLTFTYQWYANGNPIADATDASFKLTDAEADAMITVSVTGQAAGYTTGSATTAGVGPVGSQAVETVQPAPAQVPTGSTSPAPAAAVAPTGGKRTSLGLLGLLAIALSVLSGFVLLGSKRVHYSYAQLDNSPQQSFVETCSDGELC